MNSIVNLKKEMCTGCAACYNSCPVGAIEMKADTDGFLYPYVNDKCIDCGKCVKVCPSMKESMLEDKTDATCYAVWGKEEYRNNGSSGGVFGLLASRIIKNQGVVYGAAFEDGCRVLSHLAVHNEQDLNKILKSKYVQSNINDIFKDVKKNLEEGIEVLFSGCPCQVEGLKNFLGKKYDNLLTVDILCHGVPSPKAYNKFLDEVNVDKKNITRVDFRNKKYGWGTLLSVEFEDGTVHYDPHNGNYFRAFLSGLAMRESCLYCKYAKPQRVGDITLGDFWGIDAYDSKLNDKKGTSLVMLNTENGVKEFEKITDDLAMFEQVPTATVIEISTRANAALVRPTWYPKMKKCFFKHLQTDSFSKSLRYAETSIMDIGILGWWIATSKANYGSTLTDFALYKYLVAEGFSVAMISPPEFDREHAGKFNYDSGYRMTAKYSYEDMKENNKYIDSFIVSSDVLWYYPAFIKNGYFFLLDFVEDTKKKIAYSTSFGNTKQFFPDNEMLKAMSLMRRFDHVGVRELEAVDICAEKFGVEATHVMDPVFLCEHSVWEQLAEKAERKTKRKYIFAYLLDPDQKKVDVLKRISEELELDIVSITDKQFKPEEKAQILSDCGLLNQASYEEFIYHIMNAEYIVTDSYHGFCFAMIFEKQFNVIVNRARGASRFDTLGQVLQVNDRFVDNVEQIWEEKMFQVQMNYNRLNMEIDREVTRSKKWLINAITSEKKTKKGNYIDFLIREIEMLKNFSKK